MSEHTKGRLKVVEQRGARPAIFINKESGHSIAKLYNLSGWQHDARRLVACWNACEGIETAWLEQAMVDSWMVRMVEQRDELIAALRDILEEADRRWPQHRADRFKPFEVARALLAKHAPKVPA